MVTTSPGGGEEEQPRAVTADREMVHQHEQSGAMSSSMAWQPPRMRVYVVVQGIIHMDDTRQHL
eukprot:3764798-Prorocentrum_lima.AAC.1